MLMDANVMWCPALLLSASGEKYVQRWSMPGLDDTCAEAWQLLVPSACSKNVAAYRLPRDDFQS